MSVEAALVDRIEAIRAENNEAWIRLRACGGESVDDLRQEMESRRANNQRMMALVREALKRRPILSKKLLREIAARDLRVVRLTKELAE